MFKINSCTSNPMFSVMALGVLDILRRCADQSTFDLKEPREHTVRLHPRDTLMSYLDRCAQSRMTLNTPIISDKVTPLPVF